MPIENQPRKWRYDPTINLGHILTFLGFIVTIVIGWNTLDKRVVVLEEARHAQGQVDRHQDQLANQQLSFIRESLAEIKKSVDRLSDKVDER